jgi:hypothetical protein
MKAIYKLLILGTFLSILDGEYEERVERRLQSGLG